MHTVLQLNWITQSALVPFPGCQGSCGIVPNGPAGLVASINIRQGLKCLLAWSLDSDLNYVTTMPQLRPPLNH